MTAVVSAVVVTASLGVVMVAGPRLVVGTGRGHTALSDRLPVDVVVGSALAVVTAEVLVALRLFDWLGLVVAALAVASASRWRRARRREARPTIEVVSDHARAVLYLLEAASDAGNDRVKQAVRRWRDELIRPRLRRAGRTALPPGQAAWRLSVAAILAGAFLVTGAHALRHLALVPADNYQQLTAMAELRRGRMFPFGAEPVGARALLATAAEVTPASYEDVVRFAGPVLATAAIAMVCLLVLRATNRRDAALVATAVAAATVLATDGGAGSLRLAETLAVVIALCGVGIAMKFAPAPSSALARQLGLAAMGVVLVHPRSLLVMAPAVIGAGVTAAVRDRQARPLGQVLLAVGAGGVAGWLPVLLARAAGVGAAPGGDAADPVLQAPAELALVSLAGIVLTLVLVGGAVRAGRADVVPVLVLALTALAWLAVDHLPAAPSLVGRAPVPAVLLSVGVGLGLSCVTRPALVPLAVALGALLVPQLPRGLPEVAGDVVEHDLAARAVSSRLAGVTDMTYTVVGSPQSLARVVGRVWRADLGSFTGRLSLEQAADPGFVLPVPSDHLLLVAETWLPSPRGRQVEPRPERLVAERADEWMRVYARYHTGVSVFFEASGVRVWSVEQTGDSALAERYGLVFA